MTLVRIRAVTASNGGGGGHHSWKRRMVAFWGGLAGGALLFVLAQPPAPKATMPVAMNHISAQRFGFPGTLCQRDTKRGLPHPPLALVHQL